MTNKLIQELVGLCVEKTLEGDFDVFFEYAGHAEHVAIRAVKCGVDYHSGNYDYALDIYFYIDKDSDAEKNLQAAIDRVKQL